MTQLTPIEEQVIVITGASSGIGLVAAKLAAERGACVVLTARNAEDLDQAVKAIQDAGGRAVAEPADVCDPVQVRRVADRALSEFGRIDTWVNNAGVSMYGRIMETSLEDMRQQFEVDFWGTVHGSRIAIPHLETTSGTLINVASAVSDRAIPLQGIYCAAKHGVKAFTDALRMELAEGGSVVSVCLVKPSSTDTPFFGKAKTNLGVEPQPVPPVYAPEVVAKVIVDCAEKPVRDVIVGGMGKVMSVAEKIAPRLTDRFMQRHSFKSQMTDEPVAIDRMDNLHVPVREDGGERGRFIGHVRRSSLYTWAALNPARAAAGAALLGVAAFAGWKAISSSSRRGRFGG